MDNIELEEQRAPTPTPAPAPAPTQTPTPTPGPAPTTAPTPTKEQKGEAPFWRIFSCLGKWRVLLFVFCMLSVILGFVLLNNHLNKKENPQTPVFKFEGPQVVNTTSATVPLNTSTPKPTESIKYEAILKGLNTLRREHHGIVQLVQTTTPKIEKEPPTTPSNPIMVNITTTTVAAKQEVNKTNII